MNNNSQTHDDSWLLFDSACSASSDFWREQFEEIDLNDDDPDLLDSSYEVIDEQLRGGLNLQKNNSRQEVQPEVQQQSSAQDSKRKPVVKYDFGQDIKTTVESILNSQAKQEEIKNFEKLCQRFSQWYLEKRQLKYSRDKIVCRDAENGDSEASACKFLIHNSSVNSFVFSFSDVYVNIIGKKHGHKNRVQSLFAEFLREVEPEGLTREYDFKSKKINNRKLIFKFAEGTTRFIITVGLDFRVRLNHYIKLCSNLDERFLTLGSFLSYWAYKRGIFTENYLSPYALHFMVIYFLMRQTPSILPKFCDDDLQKMTIPKTTVSSSKSRMSDAENNTGNIFENHVNHKGATNLNIQELVKDFFHMFAFEVPKMQKTLSVKLGGPIENGRVIHGYSIEDPFNQDYDLCKGLNDNRYKGFQIVKGEFERAYDLLSEGKEAELCQERKC